MSSGLSPRAPGADLSQRRKVWSSAVGSMMGSGEGVGCCARDGTTEIASSVMTNKLRRGPGVKRVDVNEAFSRPRFQIVVVGRESAQETRNRQLCVTRVTQMFSPS